ASGAAVLTLALEGLARLAVPQRAPRRRRDSPGVRPSGLGFLSREDGAPVSAHVCRRSGSRHLARLAVLVAVAAGLVAGWTGVGEAHPLGNFTVNTYSGLVVRPDSVSVDFVVDMAEIPAYQTRQDN